MTSPLHLQEPNADYPGSDLLLHPNGCAATMPDVRACATRCASTAGCNTFAYTANGPTCAGGCWLKFAKLGTPVAKPLAEGWTTGVLTGVFNGSPLGSLSGLQQP